MTNTNPIKTAICSFGMSGYVFHAPFIDLHPGFHLFGVWERTKNLAVKKYPNIKTFRKLEEILADDSIELVVVNTPSVTHYEYSKLVLDAGKHLVVEKPFTATTAEADDLIQRAKAKNLIISVFQNRRWDSDFLTVKKVLTEKRLGDIMDAEIHYDRYDPGLSYKAHKEVPTPAVGNIYDLGPHIIDQAIQLFGKPNAVFADLDTKRPNSQVEDYTDLRLYYDNHRVTIKSSYYVKEELPAFIMHGTKGSFLKSRADVQEKQLLADMLPNSEGYGVEPDSERGLIHTEENGAVIKEHIPTLSGNYLEYYDGIHDAIRNGGKIPVSGEEGRDIIKIIEAARQSDKERRVINL